MEDENWLLGKTDAEDFFAITDPEQQWAKFKESIFLRDSSTPTSSKTSHKCSIFLNFIFLLYRDCKQASISVTKTLAFIYIVQECFKSIMESIDSDNIERKAVLQFQTMMIKRHGTDKLFEIHELRILTTLYATSFVQHIEAYYYLFHASITNHSEDPAASTEISDIESAVIYPKDDVQSKI